MRTEEEVKYLLKSKQELLECLRISLSSTLSKSEVDQHPAILAQQYYVRALKWMLREQQDL